MAKSKEETLEQIHKDIVELFSRAFKAVTIENIPLDRLMRAFNDYLRLEAELKQLDHSEVTEIVVRYINEANNNPPTVVPVSADNQTDLIE